MTEVQHIGVTELGQLVLASDEPILVEFWKNNCAPCRALARSLGEYARGVEGIRIVAVNVEESPSVAAKYNVLSVPALKLLVGGEVIRSFTGPQTTSVLAAELADYAAIRPAP